MKTKNMASKNLLVFLATAFVLVFALQGVSAFGNITDVEIGGVRVLGTSIDMANIAGDRVPVLIVFHATADASDVRVKAWISGERENAFVSDRFDAIAGRTYSEIVYVDAPTDLDELDEARALDIVVESKEAGTADEVEIPFTVERESYTMKILSVDTESKVNAGEVLPIDVVIKNNGRHLAEDTFVTARIPELGASARAYFGDLSPLDEVDPDRNDAEQRRLYLKIPANVVAGLYTLEIEASNDDSVAKVTKKVLVGGAQDETQLVSGATTKTFAAGETGTYSITLVNKGNTVRVYELSTDAPAELNVEFDESVVVVPAGSSRTVKIQAVSSDEGKYTFTVNADSDSQLVGSKTFTANVRGGKLAGTGNATILLTVVLAIIFIVLLVVLIVLLTRKPEKTEEFGESYY